jgi:hypothetical protein
MMWWGGLTMGSGGRTIWRREVTMWSVEGGQRVGGRAASEVAVFALRKLRRRAERQATEVFVCRKHVHTSK